MKIAMKHKCKDCNEPFTPLKYESICPECKLERDIEREEQYESKSQK